MNDKVYDIDTQNTQIHSSGFLLNFSKWLSKNDKQ